MQLTKSILLSMAMIMAVPPAFAAYPDFYLRGSEIGNGWEALETYKFDRNDNTYSFELQHLNGNFKISNADWTINYGAESSDAARIAGSTIVKGVHGGRNYQAVSLSNVRISFTYTEGSSTNIRIEANGEPVAVSGLSGTLPVLYINVLDENGAYDNEVIDKDLAHKNYFSGQYWLDLNGCQWLADLGAESIGSEAEPLPLEIKARGNYTRTAFAKKPFKLKLGSKQRMLGMSKSKHYALLAHADDNKGYLRNFTGFALGQKIELPWTPTQQPIELVINGDYRGLYFLTESIRIEGDRIDIQELEDNCIDPAIISGGYLVELDNYDEDNQIQLTEQTAVGGYTDKLRITFDTPEEYSDLQRRFVTDQFSAINELVGSASDELWSYLDLDDAVRYYIVEEVISHVEAYHGSTYLFRDRGEGQKWHFSPLWDCGNAFNGPTDGFIYHHAPYGMTWIASIRQNSRFNGHLADTWLWFISNRLESVYDDIDAYVAAISAAAVADHKRWDGQPTPAGGNAVANNSDMLSRRDNVVNRLRAKVQWLKQQFGDCGNITYAEPQRDTTPAAPLPDYALTGVESVVAGTAAPVYYNLQGLKVAHPKPGQLYIELRPDGSSRKIRL